MSPFPFEAAIVDQRETYVGVMTTGMARPFTLPTNSSFSSMKSANLSLVVTLICGEMPWQVAVVTPLRFTQLGLAGEGGKPAGRYSGTCPVSKLIG